MDIGIKLVIIFPTYIEINVPKEVIRAINKFGRIPIFIFFILL